MKRFIPLLLLFLILSPFLAGCGNDGGSDHSYRLAPLSQMPPAVQDAPATVREAYRFAVHNEDVLGEIPCYCGCSGMGHTSNYSCFIADTDEQGEITFDEHALGCSICVDIAQDAMRMVDEGKSVAEIYAAVDATYSRFGPPTPLE